MKRYFSFAILLALMLSIFGVSYAQVVPVDTFPFVEDFETGQTHNTQVQGWTQILDNGKTKYWTANSTFTNYNRTPRNGSFNAFLEYNSNAWMMRSFILEGGVSYDVEVWARQDKTSGATLAMYYGDNNTIAAMTNTIVAQVNLTNGDYQRYHGSITPATSGTYWIAIHGTATYSPWYISIDDFMVKHTPTEPMFVISPTGYDFGSLQINTTGSQTFTMMNVGIGTLNVTGISPTSDGFFSVTDAPAFPVALAAGESATFTIQYAPTAAGNHTATFTITDDLRATTEVAVSGSCYDPTISTFPWLEDFTDTTFPPADWTRYEAEYPTDPLVPSTSKWVRGNFANVSSPANPSARANVFGTSTKHWLVTPAIAIPATGYQLDFDLALTTYSGSNPVDPTQQQDDKFIVFIADNPTMVGATILKEWNNSGSTNVYNQIATLGEYQVMDLSAHVGTKYIAFYVESTISGGDCNIYVDNVRVRQTPTTPVFAYSPETIDYGVVNVNTLTDYVDVNVSNSGSGTLTLNAGDVSIIGTDAAMFSFDPANLPFNLTIGQGDVIPVRYNPTAVGEHSATLRMVYGGANYDVALSGWTVSEFALIESFEDATFPPQGWDAGSWSYSSLQSVHGSRSAYKNGSESTQYVLSTPMLTIENDSRLNFWTRCTNSTAYMQVVYSTDRATWTQIGTDFSFAAPNEVNTWYNVEVDLSSLSGSNYYLGFRTGLTGGSYYVDMVVGPDIAAIAPGAPALVSPADEATDLSTYPTFTWTAPTTGGVPASYNIYCDTNNPPTTVIGTSTTLSFTPTTALPYSSTLYWSVTAVNASGEGAQATPRSFTTVADPTIYAFPWLEDFTPETFPPTNWGRYEGLYPDGTLTPTSYRWTRANFAYVSDPANPSARINIYGTTTKHWLVTPPIAIPATGYQLDFDMALTKWNSTNPVDPAQQQDDKFIVLIADNPTMVGAVELRKWDNAGSPYVYNSISSTGEYQVIDLSAHVGTKYIAFYGESTVTGGDNALYVDNVRVRETPTAPVFSYTPDAIDFGSVQFDTASAPVNVTVSNMGSGTITLNASDISIIGPNAAEFSFGTANLPANLGTGQSVDIPVTVQSTTEGPISATLRMVYNATNYDVALSANVLQEGLIFIGEGTAYNDNITNPTPYGGYYKNGREQYIVTAAELTAAGAQAGYLYSIGFNVQNPNTCADLRNFTIWMAATDATSFTTTSFLTGLEEVYSVDFFTPIAGVNQHTLNTPFLWDGTSNIVIQTSYGMLTSAVRNASTYYTTTATQQTMYYRSDSTAWQGISTGTRSLNRPNMVLQIVEPIAGAPAAPILLSPADGATDMLKAGFNLSWSPDVINGGAPSYYTVFLATDPDAIYDGNMWETTNTNLNPVLADPPVNFEYAQRYYWTVQAINDDGDAVVDPPRSFVIEPDPTIVALPHAENFDEVTPPAFPRGWTAYKSNAASTIDVRTAQSHTPDNSVYIQTRTTTETMRLITPPIGVPMNSIKLSFWLRSTGTSNYKMKVGTVSATDETGVFTQVAEIVPTVSGEFVQYVVPFTGYTGTDNYICFEHGTTSTYQSFYIDTILLEAMPAVDMQAVSLVGPGSLKVGQEGIFNMTVLNFGTEPTANYTVNLRDINDVLLATAAVTEEIASGATDVIPINWTPTTAGTFSVYAEVVATGDADESNNATAAQSATVYSATTEFIPIGATENLTTVTYAPFDAYYKGFVAETVYLASEIQATGGTIQSLAYYSNFNSEYTFSAQIWMKNTDVSNMNVWPQFEGYTLVYSGDLTVPAGINEIVIPITPFAYTGGNLSIRTTKAYQTSWSSGKNWYTTVDTNYPSRTIYHRSDTEGAVIYDAPTDGITVNNVPNITFIMDPATVVNTVAAPEVSETALVGTNVALTWGAVPYAYSYKVYASEDPYTFGTEPTAIVYSNGATLPTTAAKGFYKVTANTYRDNNRGPSMWSRLLNANITENPIEKDKDLLRK